MSSNSEIFLSIYNQVDDFFRNKQNKESYVPHTNLIREATESYISETEKRDLLSFARLRNAIVHNPHQGDADPLAEPHDVIVEKYKQLKERILNPPSILTIAVKSDNIYKVRASDSVKSVMDVMNVNLYTHVPIVNEEKIMGVFSENTIFTFLLKNGISILEQDTKIKEFEEFYILENHNNEYFQFVSRNTNINEVKSIFKNELQENKRLGAVYITHSGRSNESLLGMVTQWDMIGQ